MWIVNLLLLVALGVLGVASWLRQKRPDAAGPLAQLEGIGGWIGLAGLVWGIWILIGWISSIGVLTAAPLMMIIALVTALVITALSLILAMPALKTLIGANDFTRKLEALSAKLGAFKVILGAVCLGLAVYTLVIMAV